MGAASRTETQGSPVLQPDGNFCTAFASSGGDPILHGVGMNERETDVYTSLAERTGHMLVLGATRVGKTRLAELLIGQDILRGDAVIVLDPKGDTELLRRIYHEAGRAGRRSDLRIFHLRHPEESQTYNPIANYHAPTEIASRISEQLPRKAKVPLSRVSPGVLSTPSRWLWTRWIGLRTLN